MNRLILEKYCKVLGILNLYNSPGKSTTPFYTGQFPLTYFTSTFSRCFQPLCQTPWTICTRAMYSCKITPFTYFENMVKLFSAIFVLEMLFISSCPTEPGLSTLRENSHKAKQQSFKAHQK